MFFYVYFEKTDKIIDFNNQHRMNGFIFKVLGENASKYHDSFSKYSISSIQGGHMSNDKKGLVFNSRPYIQFSSENMEFLNDFSSGILNAIENKNADFFGLYPVELDGPYEFNPMVSGYDVVKTISPILVRDSKGKKLTCKDASWADTLTDNCKRKLEHEGVNDPSFKIEIKNPTALKTKMVWVGETFNPTTIGIFAVYGRPETRRKLYTLGFGNSTGSGFGAVNTYSFLNKKRLEQHVL